MNEEKDMPDSHEPGETRQQREERIVAELKQIIDDLYETDDYDLILEISNRISRRSKMLEEKLPDFKLYRLWHVLGGSTTIPDKPMKFDFEGADSLETYIRNLDKEYRGR